MTPFIPGLELSRAFFTEIVQPLLASSLPDLHYSAALIGSGSEVLGYDTEQSTDHHWGPRLQIFLNDADAAEHREAADSVLRTRLPVAFRGYATNFGPPDAIGVRLPVATATGPVDHMIEIVTVRSFIEDYLGIDPWQPLDPIDWLTLSEHKLLTLVRGEVFHDGLDALEPMRWRFAYYPRDVWLAMLAARWHRISEEEAFVGRCGEVGDDLGSRLVTARLVRDLMRLGFLLERTYVPYAKWFGTAFRALPCGERLTPILTAALAAETWRERETHLSAAYEIVAAMQNATGITAPLPAEVSHFHDRPYRVIHGERFASAIREVLPDTALWEIAAAFGSVNQLIDATDITSDVAFRPRFRALYEPAPSR